MAWINVILANQQRILKIKNLLNLLHGCPSKVQTPPDFLIAVCHFVGVGAKK